VVTGVLDAASLLPGPLAAGQLIVISGNGLGPEEQADYEVVDGGVPASLAGTQVLVDGIPAPLLSVSASQVNAVTPFAMAAALEAKLQVVYRGVRGNLVSLQVAPAVPGLFTLDTSGKGQAFVLNDDDSPNSAANPAGRGSIVALHATGLGETDPQVADGAIATSSGAIKPRIAIRASVGGLDAQVVEVGAVPGVVVGYFRIRVRIPQDAPAGDAVPVSITAGEIASRQEVTLALR
jgi:uncharacterized protein (TIGR03437 family)